MIKTEYYCDGCGAKMTQTEYDDSIAMAHEFGRGMENLGTSIVKDLNVFDVPIRHCYISEIFCKTCVNVAPDWWAQKGELVSSLMDEVNKRLSRNRMTQFSQHKASVKLKAVK